MGLASRAELTAWAQGQLGSADTALLDRCLEAATSYILMRTGRTVEKVTGRFLPRYQFKAERNWSAACRGGYAGLPRIWKSDAALF